MKRFLNTTLATAVLYGLGHLIMHVGKWIERLY